MGQPGKIKKKKLIFYMKKIYKNEKDKLFTPNKILSNSYHQSQFRQRMKKIYIN